MHIYFFLGLSSIFSLELNLKCHSKKAKEGKMDRNEAVRRKGRVGHDGRFPMSGLNQGFPDLLEKSLIETNLSLVGHIET